MKNPAIPTAMTAITTPTEMVKMGYWKNSLIDWKLLRPAIRPPSTIQKNTTPTDIDVPRARHRRRFSAAALSPMIFRGMTGRTHGVKFSRSPPTAATRRSSRKPPVPLTSIEKPAPKTSNSTISGAAAPPRISAKTAESKSAKTGSDVLTSPPRAAPAATTSIVASSVSVAGARQNWSSQVWKVTSTAIDRGPGAASAATVMGTSTPTRPS